MARKRTPAPPDAPYRIKDVADRSGFSRETIRFYTNQGLLPPPVKTSHNMGWYTDRHLETLAMIRKLQNERFLPLKAIKSLMLGVSEDFEFSEQQLDVLGELRRLLATEHRDLVVNENAGELAKEMGLTRREQKELRDLGFARSGAATFSDVEVTRLWLQMKEAGLSEARGFSPKDLAYLIDLVDSAVTRELDVFQRRIDRMSASEVRKLLDVVVPSINSIFAILHERRLNAYVQAYFESALKKSQGAAVTSSARLVGV
jgi:DNA-binding transcriptional MerR regulator